MNAQTENRKTTIRNLIIFVIVFNVLGWLGWMVAQDGSADALGLGNLIWLAAPLLVSLLLRLFSKDWRDMGLAPRFGGNGKWYLFSIVVFPLIVTAVLLTGLLFGGVSLANFAGGLFFQALGVAFISTFVKNILEEFAWRGYLTPKVNTLVKNRIAGHLLVGFIWGTWHIPYYLGLLDQATLASYTSQSLATFLPMIVMGTTLAGIIFGEIRLITGSTWPAVLMHTMSNVVILTLLVDGHVSVSSALFTPSWEGVLTMIFITAAGVWLYRRGRNHEIK